MKAFIDTNVLLEAALPGRRHAEIADRALVDGNTAISPLSVHLFVHFGQKEGFSIRELVTALEGHDVVQFGPTEVEWAFNNCQGNDFEDALQVACALFASCTVIRTFDTRLAKRYSQFIKVELLA